MKEPEDRYLAVVENHALIGASTITLMKLKHIFVKWWRSHAWMSPPRLL